MSLRAFEKKIIEDFKTFSPWVGGGRSRPRKGFWIRGHLLDVGEDFVYRMFERWRAFVEEAERRGAKITVGDYNAFRTYVWLLARERLILPTRKERSKSPKFLRQYYKLNPSLVESAKWRNPFAQFSSWQAWKKKGFPHKKQIL